jgi:hypothetical protein
MTTSPKNSVNAFALRRNESASKSVSSPRTDSTDNTREFRDLTKKNPIVIDDDEPASDDLSNFVSYYKKYKESRPTRTSTNS